MVLVHPSPYMGVQAPFSTIRFGNVQQKGSTTERKKNLGRVAKARTRRTGDDGRDADKAFQFHTTLLKHSRQLRTYHIVRTPRVHHSKTRIQCCFLACDLDYQFRRWQLREKAGPVPSLNKTPVFQNQHSGVVQVAAPARSAIGPVRSRLAFCS